MGTKTWVLLNSARVVNEIIAKRAMQTHERPSFPVAGGLVSRNNRFFLHKTKDWKEGRRLLHNLLLSASAKHHAQVIEDSSLKLLQIYLDEPQTWYAHHYHFAMDIMHRIVTNAPLQQPRSDLQDLQKVTSSFLSCINSSFVEFFPQLAQLPIAMQFWRPHWEGIGKFHNDVFKRWWAHMKLPKSSNPTPSFARGLLLEDFKDREEKAMYLSMLAMSAGADNPRMTMNAWVMACLAYPEKMEQARKQIVSVCGEDERLPVLADLPQIPYMCAVVKEVLRWRPTVPLVPQRVSVEDIEFEGYLFPAGTEFLINSIAVCNDGYENPGEFQPERWLGDNNLVTQELWQFAFSAGRRSCVGYKLAQKELFVSLSRLLYCFEFTPKGVFDDKRLNAFSPGEPFSVNVKVRSKQHEELIRNTHLHS
jgi:cytochrome P450